MVRTKGRPSHRLDNAVSKKKKNTKPEKKKLVCESFMTDNENAVLINKCDNIVQTCDNVISASCHPCAVKTGGEVVTRRTRGLNKSCQNVVNKSVSDIEKKKFCETEGECIDALEKSVGSRRSISNAKYNESNNKLYLSTNETFIKDLETSEHALSAAHSTNTLDTVSKIGNDDIDTKCSPLVAKKNDINTTRQNSRSLTRSCKIMKRKSNNSIENEEFDSNDNNINCLDKQVNFERSKRNKCNKADSENNKNLPINSSKRLANEVDTSELALSSKTSINKREIAVGTSSLSAKKTKDSKQKRQTRRGSKSKRVQRKSIVSSEDEVFGANGSNSDALDELETIIRSRFIKHDEETSTNNLPLNSIETKFLNELDSSEHTLTSTPSITKRKRNLESKVKKSKTVKLSASVDEACKTDTTSLTDTVTTHTDDEPWHNMSLPTPTIGSSHSMSNDATLDVDACDDTGTPDSDDELPIGLTPMKYEKTISENDLVWVKWKKCYYPAFLNHCGKADLGHVVFMVGRTHKSGDFASIQVKILYKKTKHLTCIFFSPASEPQQTLRMSYANTNKVMPYFHPRREELKRAGDAGPERAYFKACLQRLEDFLLKKALHQLKGDDLSYFKTDALDFLDLGDDIVTDPTATDVTQDLVPVPKVVVNVNLSKKGQLRKVKLSEKTKPLTEFLISEECKDYLTKIYLTKLPSDLHDTFMTGTRKQRIQMKHKGFGPIDDEDQIETIILTYIGWLGECCTSEYLHMNDYVFDVWIPEAIVRALTTMKSYSKKKALEMFAKGVRITKEELMIDHEAIIRKSASGIHHVQVHEKDQH